MSSPVPVTIAASSVTWTTWGVALLNLLVGGALVAFIRSRAPIRKINADREANLLEERAKEMASMRERIEKLEKLLELSNEEMRVLRHDLANANQSLDLFIELIEANPERAAEHAKRVKAKRDQGKAQVSVEKAALAVARTNVIAGKSE